jgi:hypothetical protein
MLCYAQIVHTLLGQIDPKSAAEGLGANFLPWALVIVLFALAWVVKVAIDQNREHAKESAETRQTHAKEIAALQGKLLETVQAHAKEQRELLTQLVPLASALAEGAEHLERVADSLTGKD